MFLSHRAWEGLITQATEAGFVRGGLKARGLSKFMDGLLLLNPYPDQWVDTRPRHIQATDLSRLTEGLLPIWSDGDVKWPRGHKFRDLDKTAQLAKEIGITRTGRTLSRHNTISEFWEAVGLGWLKPKNIPPPPAFRTKPRRVRTELDW
jgi:hypothetical protein